MDKNKMIYKNSNNQKLNKMSKLKKVKPVEMLVWDHYKSDAKKRLVVADLGKKYIKRYVTVDKYKDSNQSERYMNAEAVKEDKIKEIEVTAIFVVKED